MSPVDTRLSLAEIMRQELWAVEDALVGYAVVGDMMLGLGEQQEVEAVVTIQAGVARGNKMALIFA